jgi:hypothetical protein
LRFCSVKGLTFGFLRLGSAERLTLRLLRLAAALEGLALGLCRLRCLRLTMASAAAVRSLAATTAATLLMRGIAISAAFAAKAGMDAASAAAPTIRKTLRMTYSSRCSPGSTSGKARPFRLLSLGSAATQARSAAVT